MKYYRQFFFISHYTFFILTFLITYLDNYHIITHTNESFNHILSLIIAWVLT